MTSTGTSAGTSARRIGAPDSKTRALLLDAAERLLLDEGYAAVTSRRVAAKAGLKPQLVHYYFRTMDDLFLEVFRRRAEEGLRRRQEALATGRPLHLLWDEFGSDREAAAFNVEFTALANHRKAIRSEIARYGERFREMHLDAVAGVLDRNGISADELPPAVLMLAMTGVSVVLGLEAALGITGGHEQTVAFVRRYLDRLES